MENKIELLKEYINKEVSMFECEPEDTSSFTRVKAFLDYRNIRIKQAWYAKISKGETSREYASRRSELDKERRLYHNAALTALLSFDRAAEVLDLPPIYTGKKLTKEQIESHDSGSLDARKEMTDWFFGLVNEIYDYTPEREDLNKRKEEGFIESLQGGVYKFDREYGVEEPIREDDGDVIFDIDRDDI